MLCMSVDVPMTARNLPKWPGRLWLWVIMTTPANAEGGYGGKLFWRKEHKAFWLLILVPAGIRPEELSDIW